MKRLLILITLPISLQAMELSVVKDGGNFSVFNGEKLTAVHSYDVDPFLSKLSDKQFAKFHKNGGYVKPVLLSNGDYKLQAKARIKGGGPITGYALAWTIRALGYGVTATTAGAEVVAMAAVTGPAVVVTTAPVVTASSTAILAATESMAAIALIGGTLIPWLP